jgi:hypothetical protein
LLKNPLKTLTHSAPDGALSGKRTHIMIFDSPEVAVYQTTKMPRAHPTLSTSNVYLFI